MGIEKSKAPRVIIDGLSMYMYTTEGIILKRSDTGEADSFFTIYTKDFGKIRALAQGVKKGDAKLKGHLEPLSLSAISLVTARSGLRLTAAVLQAAFPDTRNNYNKLAAGFSVVELLDKECLEGEKDEKLWNLILETLFIIERENTGREDLAKVIRAFERKLTSNLGYEGSEEVLTLGAPVTFLS